jgi:hypothetical protein
VSKFQQTAMARQRMRAEDRRPFWLYIDEFHHFITPSMAEILSGARKYRMGLTLAHQELTQLKREPEVASAVLSNACTRIVFRVADGEAKSLESGFVHFAARELQNLEVGEAICRVERSDADFNLNVPFFEDGDEAEHLERRDQVIDASRQRYATPRAQIEESAQQPAVTAVAELMVAENKPIPPMPVTQPTRMPDELKSELAAIKEQLQKVAQAKEASEPVAKTLESPVVETAQRRPYEPTVVRMDVEKLGRGGELHKEAQIELKQIAEAHGFRATIERQLPASLETVDLYLQRDKTEIGCEISVTNSLDYELRNVAKILRAGVPMVAMIALDSDKLSKLEAAIRNTLSPEDNAKVRCFLKPQFVDFIQSLVVELPQLPPLDGGRKVKGWKVKRTTVEISAEELQRRQADLAATMADSARRVKARKRET